MPQHVNRAPDPHCMLAVLRSRDGKRTKDGKVRPSPAVVTRAVLGDRRH